MPADDDRQRVLDLLDRNRRALDPTAVAGRLGLSVDRAFEALQTLAREGKIERGPSGTFQATSPTELIRQLLAHDRTRPWSVADIAAEIGMEGRESNVSTPGEPVGRKGGRADQG